MFSVELDSGMNSISGLEVLPGRAGSGWSRVRSWPARLVAWVSAGPHRKEKRGWPVRLAGVLQGFDPQSLGK
jgi:hypothetical protein